MANPNIVNVSTINGSTAVTALSTTATTSLISNAASSGTVIKVNNIFVSIVNGVAAATITVSYHSAASAGGTGLSSYTAGDMIYASATNTLNKLAKGTDGQVLTLASGVPTWSASTGASTGKAIAMAMVFGA